MLCKRSDDRFLNLTDEEVLAKTLHGEAGVEKHRGRLLVATVIWNRAKGDIAQLRRVCLKPMQFSCWNRDEGLILARVQLRSPAWGDCVLIARSMLSGEFKPLNNADHYFADYIVPPKWSLNMKFICQEGVHKFFKAT